MDLITINLLIKSVSFRKIFAGMRPWRVLKKNYPEFRFNLYKYCLSRKNLGKIKFSTSNFHWFNIISIANPWISDSLRLLE